MGDFLSQRGGSFAVEADSVQPSMLHIEVSVNEVDIDPDSRRESAAQRELVIAQEFPVETLRILAEDLSWGIVEEPDEAEQPANVPPDGGQASKEALEIGDNVDKRASVDENEEMKDLEKKDTQIALEVLEGTVAQATSAQVVALAELAEESTFTDDIPAIILVEPVEAIGEQEPEKTSETQLPTTPPDVKTVEQKEEVRVEENEKVIIEEKEDLTAEEWPFSEPQAAPYDTRKAVRMSVLPDLREGDLHKKKDELIRKLNVAMMKQESLRGSSLNLQMKIAEVYKKTKVETKQDPDKKFAPNEETYVKTLAKLQMLRETLTKNYEHRHLYTTVIKEKCQQKKEEVEAERKKFYTNMRKVVLGALYSHTRKPIPPENVEYYVNALSSKENAISKVRLGIIKLKNKTEKKAMLLRSKEELDDGLHLQDFEQLKIENQTYNEKIEERNEDMLKLKKRISSTVQILSHCKEKLHFMQNDNHQQVHNLKDAETALKKSRDVLAKLKRARDVVKAEHTKLHGESGLLGNKSLLNDFEIQKDKILELNSELRQLKIKHHILSTNCNVMQDQISEASKKLSENQGSP